MGRHGVTRPEVVVLAALAAVSLYVYGLAHGLTLLPALLSLGVLFRGGRAAIPPPPPPRRHSPAPSDTTSSSDVDNEDDDNVDAMPPSASDAMDRRRSSAADADCLHMLRVTDEVGSGSDVHIGMNSTAPVPFENDLFVGHVYFLVKTDPPNATWHHLFDKRKRMFWIQVQGRFKRQPRGVVYLGGELPDRISLGFFTRSLASVIMSIIQTLVKAVHYAFGDANELPHCVFPLYQSVDEMVITPPGETPPVLGQEAFGESKAEHLGRMKTPCGTEVYDLDAIYTFHFHTMYVDLTQWTIINLPGMKDVALTTFFEGHPLRLVCYDVVAAKNRHDKHAKDYVFCFSVAYTTPDVRRHSRATLLPSATAVDNSDDEPLLVEPPPATATAIVGVPYWLEMVDFALRKRCVVYLVAVAETLALQTVHSAAWRPSAPTPLHVRSRLGRYTAIEHQRRALDDAAASSTVVAAQPLLWPPSSATRLGVRIRNQHRQHMVFQQETFRAISSTFLRQEFVVLTQDGLHLYRSQSKSPVRSIPINVVVGATACTWCPGLDHTFVVQTLYETLYFAVPSAHAVAECLKHLHVHKPPTPPPLCLDDLQAMWAIHTTYAQPDGSTRSVLNARALFPSCEPDPTSAIERVLEAAIKLNMLLDDSIVVRKDAATLADKVSDFLDAACALRSVELRRLERYEDRLCFYLNVYQALLWHAKVAFGPPKQWLPFSRRVCYAIGPLELSLADMEHAILRAKLPPSVLAPPWHKTIAASMRALQASYGVQHPDFRISFVLHVLEPLVTFFDGDYVHEQLNAAMGRYLQDAIRVDDETRVITLPKICEWHKVDFGAANKDGVHCARRLLGFLDGDLHSRLRRLVEADPPPHIKYA
ncbi:hypothetical protein SDRG_07558 [Saprolegnia diclina VS20]|uniref:Uncharacterized protein n=1 Tax=Saprolegnia diclina (strain VS20) TaxID=1156394 RepID=T0QLQ1_SAPDV|nr:hypothetical protein SDRG_07558 [Saprolegnia diclina VS20]EQC34745.1 hypothetical protein SDRG_07558 [Saprolegnia diclina VS20]|eukprot:XP_008611617.1 hypothetical protein SDRG_07558 [Saprolegnia diclina VS20]